MSVRGISPVEKLDLIADQMERLAHGRDIEALHGSADDLLLEAFQWATSDRLVRESSERIAVAYKAVPKWYA